MIDRDYRGNVGVVIFNLGQTDYEVHQGDRVAQLVIERISIPTLVEVEVRHTNLDLLHVYILLMKIIVHVHVYHGYSDPCIYCTCTMVTVVLVCF